MSATTATEVDLFIEGFNRSYESKHRAYEENFWSTKMNLAGSSTDELNRTKCELDAFLGDKTLLEKVRSFLSDESSVNEGQRKVLKIFERTFQCYIIEEPSCLELKERIGKLEGELAKERNLMNLGYFNPMTDGGQESKKKRKLDECGKEGEGEGEGEESVQEPSFVKCSSVQLRNTMRTSDSAEVRKACYNGLRSIGTFVAENFCEIVKLRNIFARAMGYECFYDMKVSQAEGFDKKTLFGILDDLEAKTRPIMHAALAKLAAEKGEDALLPENIGYALAGDVSKLKDPYFPFENAVDAWARSFAALGISYRGSTMRLDLCDRAGKYSNGFCHWPQPAWQSPNGWIPSETNFTSLASPKAVGSGHTALVTLMHEGGHAAHFANVTQGSPLFSQERAPTSVAYAENQSMFLDSLVSDAAWMGRYALSREGEVIPWDVVEKGIRCSHGFEVLTLRGMLAVPYFEKSLYELPADELNPESLQKLADEVEHRIQGGLSARPLLSVPHILADESAAYYHGYVLAEMSVHQTRAHFLSKYGRIVDEERVGKDLVEIYWKPGNSEPFMSLVERLTGIPLSADAWVAKLGEDLEESLSSERLAYEEAVRNGPKFPVGSGSVDLDMRVLFVHGDEVVADSSCEGGLRGACEAYKTWLRDLK